jgi:hypothetical protein
MAWVSKDVGNWYSFESLIKLDILLNSHELIEGFSEDISLKAKLTPCVGAALKNNVENYFYPSLRPGTDSIRTAIEAQRPPRYGILEFSLSDEYLSSNNYSMSLFFLNTYLKSHGDNSKVNHVHKFKSWSNLFDETKQLVVPFDKSLISGIKFKVDYLI